MGTAVLAGMLQSKTADAPVSKFIATVNRKESAEKLRSSLAKHAEYLTVIQGDNLKAFQDADIILLACKPYVAKIVLDAPGVKEALRGKLIISVLAGTSREKLVSYIYGLNKTECFITRAIPNIAARICSSMTLIEQSTTQPLPPHLHDLTHWIFTRVGSVSYIIPDLFDVGAALAGAGIAFLTVAFDGLLDGSVSEGIKRDAATEMLAQTMLGMARLIMGGEHPAVLREEISSPRGMTIRGLLALEAGNVRISYSKAIIDATAKAKVM